MVNDIEAIADGLSELLAKATSSCPSGVESDGAGHRYWLNGVTRARIEIVKSVPALLDHITTLEAENASLREALGRAATMLGEMYPGFISGSGPYSDGIFARDALIADLVALSTQGTTDKGDAS